MSASPLPSHKLVVQDLVDRHRDRPGALLPLLHAIQEAIGHIPPAVVSLIAQGLNLSRAEVHGVLTDDHFCRSEAPGRQVVQVCRAESCQARGAEALLAHAEQRLGCAAHRTRTDGAVTQEPVYCLGLCAMSPPIMVGDQLHARMTPQKFDHLVDSLVLAA